ncbi:MAG: helix-turn-helix domain-containing protein [Armatimonadota bacterium]
MPAFLTVREVCQVLRVQRSKCYEIMRSGQLEYIQVGPRSRRISALALLRFIEEAQS